MRADPVRRRRDGRHDGGADTDLFGPEAFDDLALAPAEAGVVIAGVAGHMAAANLLFGIRMRLTASDWLPPRIR